MPQVGQKRTSPETGVQQVFNKNHRWENVQQPSSRHAQHSKLNDARSDFSTSSGTQTVSVFDDDFTDVLIDRYGDDPREVDKERFELQYKESQARQQVVYAQQRYDYAQQRYDKFANENNKHVYQKDLDEIQGLIDQRKAEYRAAHAESVAYDENNPVEWPQYYLVSGGHLHNDTGCHSLRANTTLYPYAEASGMEDDESIELAGSRICTHCIPDAPVDIEDRPSHVWTPDEREKMELEKRKQQRLEEKKKAQEEKERKKQELDKKRREQGGHFLASGIPVEKFSLSWEPYTSSEIDTVPKLNKYLKEVFMPVPFEMLSTHFNEGEQQKKFDIDYVVDSEFSDTIDDRATRVKAVEDHYGTDNYWLIKMFNGDLSKGEESLYKTQAAIQELADSKNQPFDKVLNTLTSKRTVNKTKESADKQYQDVPGGYDKEDTHKRIEDANIQLQELIKDPSLLKKMFA